jgi:HTH-type transcriptional regulator/antitoxin MqsA
MTNMDGPSHDPANIAVDSCVGCGSSDVHEVISDRTINVGAYSVTIPSARHMACGACGGAYQTGAQVKALDAAVIDARRRREELLSGSEIRRIRLAVSLSQADMEEALGIGPKTLVRWENSTSIQSKTVDDVLRLIEFDHDNLRLLVRIRSAACAAVIDDKLSPQDRIKDGEIETAILDGLERTSAALGSELTRRIADAVLDALRTYKREKIEKLAIEKRIA